MWLPIPTLLRASIRGGCQAGAAAKGDIFALPRGGDAPSLSSLAPAPAGYEYTWRESE